MLFEKTGELVAGIEGKQRPEIYKQTIIFLEEYVTRHFDDEETYFESLGYIDEAEHKKQHEELAQQVKKYSNELKQSNYALNVVKKMAGMLSAWLVYHVVKEDLKYVERIRKEAAGFQGSSYTEYFANSTIQVLEAMAGLNIEDVNKTKICEDDSQDDVFIEIGLVGDLKGRVIFGFTKEFASSLVEIMMSFAPEEIDELVCSALAEVSNIASGNGTIAISEKGIVCDICPPKILEKCLDTIPVQEKIKLKPK